ncbi:unnamed protein product [Rotaria socialis]
MDWNRVVFTDERFFHMKQVIRRVWKKRGEQYYVSTIKHPVKVHVWGCFSQYGFGKLVLFKHTLNSKFMCTIYKNGLLPSTKKWFGNNASHWKLLEDNDPKHTSKMCKRFKVDNGIQSLAWPSQSPDCNPIENVWSLLKLKINKQPRTSTKNFIRRIKKDDIVPTYGAYCKIDKCHFCKTQLKYLGHIVSKEGIHPDPDKLNAVREYPVPAKLKAVRTFLGLSSYYRRFIKSYATIAEPLIALTRHSDLKSFQWSEACQNSFETLRQRLIEAPIISYPQFDQPFILQLDASDVGLSAILAQKLIDQDGKAREHVIGYASRTLSASERKYSPTERECLAIVYGCNYYRPYIEGTRFTAITDHKALKWLHSTKDLNSRLARWAIQIATYDIDIQHRPGSENGPPDALSRYPINVNVHRDDDELSPSIISTITSDYFNINYIDDLSTVSYDPGSLLLLDYFRNNSLPPHSLSIPISLISTSTKSTDVLDSTIANIHFADNINLYEQIRTTQWKDSSILPLLNFLQNQITPTIDNLPKFYGLARLHWVIHGALYRIFHNKHSSERLLLVIPSSEMTNILQLAHDHAAAAHL